MSFIMNKQISPPFSLKCRHNKLHNCIKYSYIFPIFLIVNVGFSLAMPYHPVPTSVVSEVDSSASSTQTSIQASRSVGDLLASLFKQTIYNRIENLLLDPGRPSPEKQKIIDSAVHNYHNQKYLAPLHPENEKTQLKPMSSPESSETTVSNRNTSKKVARSSAEGEILSSSDDKGIDISSLAGKFVSEYLTVA